MIRVAIVQMEASYFAIEQNEEKTLSLVEEALAQEADLLVFPEGVNLGYFILDHTKTRDEALSLALEMAPTLSSPWVEELKKRAQQGIHIAWGGFFKGEENELVNALVLISPEGRVFTYHKAHLYHQKEVREEDFVRRGSKLRWVDTALGRFGLSICYDLNFPEVTRTLTLKGAQIILLPAAWPKMAGASWDILLPARAFENEVFVVGCNQTGGEFYGHSKILDYMGNVIVEFEEEEGVKIAEIDLERLEKWRKIVTFLEDRRPDLYDL